MWSTKGVSVVAIYHLHVKRLSRNKGHSAIKASAYRSGQIMTDELGKKINYSNRPDIEPLEIVSADWMPDWCKDRQTLWQNVEDVEKRKDAQLAIEIEFALPLELSPEEKKRAIHDMLEYLANKTQAPLDASIHNKPENPHIHIMLPTRTVTPDGWGKKNRDLMNKEDVRELREVWQSVANKYLMEHNIRIDCRSYADQGINKVPGKHLGKRLWQKIKELIKQGIQAITKPNPKRIQQPEQPQVEQKEYRDPLLEEYIKQHEALKYKYADEFEKRFELYLPQVRWRQKAEYLALCDLQERENHEMKNSKKIRQRDRGGYER